MEEINSAIIQKATSLHKEMVYTIVTDFAILDAYITHYLASQFEVDIYERIKFTDVLLTDTNSKVLFKYFIEDIKRKGRDEPKVAKLVKCYNQVRNLV